MTEFEKYRTFRQRFPELASYLREWCSEQPSRKCVSYLVAAATALAMKYVSGPVRAAALIEEVGPYLSAQSAVADLFKKRGPESALCKALNPCQRGDLELVLVFIRYAVQTARNALQHHLKFTDPFGSDVFNVVKDAYDDSRILVWPQNHPKWMTARDIIDLNRAGKIWTPDELNCILSESIREHRSDTVECIVQTITVVSSTDGYQRFTEIRLLHRELCSVLLQWSQCLETAGRVSSFNPELTLKISRVLAQVRGEGHERLQSYRHAEKIGEDGIEALHRALNAYLDDLRQDGHRPPSRYAYVAAQWPGLTQQQYIVQFRSPFQGAINYVEQRLRDLLG